MILFCVLCENLVDVSAMQLVKDFRGHGKASRACFLDRKNGSSHVVLKPIADQINGLIDEIVGMLRTHGSHSEKSLAAKKQNQLSCFSRQQLLDYRDQLRLKQEFNRLPASDLKQKLARFRESEARMASNALPEEWSASRLKGNVELLKHACRRFGVEAVNARLRGES